MITRLNELRRLLAEIDSLMASAEAQLLVRDIRKDLLHGRRAAAKALQLLKDPCSELSHNMLPEGMHLVPFEPTEQQWSGTARDIVSWLRAQPPEKHTPAGLKEYMTNTGSETPSWMISELDHAPQGSILAKGTIATLIYKASLKDAGVKGGE